VKIRNLTIQNFKNIHFLQMEDIPDLVVLAGPNGSGKTSVFDALRLLKAITGPYHSGELSTIQSYELRNEVKHVVNLSADYADVACGFAISQSERNYLLKLYPDLEKQFDEKGLLRDSIRIQKGGAISSNASAPLSELLRHYDPTDEIGVMEYIPSNREISVGEVSAISLSPDILEQEKLERTASARQKFNRLKYYLAMMVIYDKMQITEAASKFIPEVQGFFKEFFFPKEFEGVKVDRSFRWQFPVKTPDGAHDVDFLSSGEKEILMTYTDILRMKLTGSVILFDEPELHLNAALERKVIERMKTVVEAGNQVWLSTHSLEIIGTVPLDNLYKMYLRPPSGTNNQIERCSAKGDRFDALRLLGASIGIQLVSNRVVFVEGPSDKEILERLYADYGDRLSFVETKGLSTWSSLSRVIPELIDKVTAYESTYLIRDRDLLTDAEVAETETRFKGKVFVWRRRGIENYLLDPTTILKVLNRLNIRNLTSIDQVTGGLRHLADEMKTNVLLDIIAFELNKETYSPFGFPRLSSEEAFESTVVSVLESKKQRILARLEREKLGLETKKRDLDEIWSSRWLELVDGKELLQAFIDRYIGPEAGALDLTHFRNLLVAEMRASGAIPEDIRRIMDVVVQGIR
jgi:hypothetical protein